MESGKITDGSHNNNNKLANNVLLHHDQRLPCSSSSEVLDSLWIANSSPSFHGSASMVKFEERTRERPFFPQSEKEENDNDDYDGCFPRPEKKRRLLPEQVQFLEKNFEIENKLEPERKVQLAKQIGLQPRQVAIWFQNRRARYKTKHIEKEFDSLKANYDKLKEDYDTLFKVNEKLKNEVHELKEKLVLREKEKIISTVNAEPQNQCPIAVSENVSSVPIGVCKNLEDASSAKSDVFDSDSPHFSLDDSSNMFEPDLSDHFSQDEDESLSKKLFHAPSFTQLEAECYSDLQENPSILGHPIEEHGTWFWNF